MLFFSVNLHNFLFRRLGEYILLVREKYFYKLEFRFLIKWENYFFYG